MADVGDLIDVWVVEARLGGGGTAEVYRCHNKDATRILAAVKLLDRAVSKYPNAKARFVREAEILFTLNHPNIVKVRNVRFEVDMPYLEMEWVIGESLEKVLRRGPVDYPQAVKRMGELMNAVEYLHRKGIRHRDIKPANIILANTGNLVLVDFGLAVELAGDRITSQEAMFGTVSYAPPEWVTPGELDPRAWDIYACGIVFFEMLTGAVAFPVPRDAGARRQALQVMTAKREVDFVDPGEGFPEEARALIRDMTHKEPEKRPQTADEVIARMATIERLVGHSPTPQVRQEHRPTGPTLLAPDSQTSDPDSSALPERHQEDTWTDLNSQPDFSEESNAETAVRPAPKDGVRNAVQPESGMSPAVVLVGVFAVLLVGFLGLGVIWAATATLTQRTPADRAVDVLVAGVPSPDRIGLRLAGQRPVGRDGFTFHFKHIPLGPAPVDWVVGADCDDIDCPGASCPAWCATGSSTRDVSAGDDTQMLSLEVTPPAPVKLSVSVPGATDELPITFILGDLRKDAKKQHDFPAVVPGRHELEVAMGSCTSENRGCAGSSSCPDGCVNWVGPVEVPVGQPLVTFEVPVGPPEIKAKATKAKVSAAGRRSGKPVTKGAFGSWLAGHASWQRDAAIASGKADSNYLRKFDATQAPGAAVTGVSWAAANAFCSGRGGLAPLNAAPHAWAENAAQPFQEWRSAGGRPSWRRYDGATSEAARASESNAFTGFRCRR